MHGVNKHSTWNNRTETKYYSTNHMLLEHREKEGQEKHELILIWKCSIQKINRLVISQYIIGKINTSIPKKFYFNYLILIF